MDNNVRSSARASSRKPDKSDGAFRRPVLTAATSNANLFKRRVLQVVGDIRNQKSHDELTEKLQERLDEQNICEIMKGSGRSHKKFCVRSLYAYVVKAITAVPNEYTKSERMRKTVAANAKANMRMSIVGVIPQKLLKQGTELGKQPDMDFLDSVNETEGGEAEEVTIRERLGSFIHPRDIRKLFMSFSVTTEPEIIVRRHVVVLNFDTLRAIVLRDRVLIFNPPGDEDMIDGLEEKIRKGIQIQDFARDHFKAQEQAPKTSFGDVVSKLTNNSNSSNPGSDLDYFSKEWGEMKLGEKGEGWMDLSFELRCIDSILETVAENLLEDANGLMTEAESDMQSLLKTRTINSSLVRQDKEKIQEMISRVQGFSRALDLLLDNNEDLALMNLSRLLSHPERFIQPVPIQILSEEADEPELILEAHLQEVTTLSNELGLTCTTIESTREELDQRRDTVRNRLLYAEMILSIFSLAVGLASLVGSYMGMNLTNHIETDPNAFGQTVIWTTVAALIIIVILMLVMHKNGVLPRIEEL